MVVTPIGARCHRCGRDFHLFEVRDDRSGRCPRCGWILAPDWTDKLLHDATRADAAQRHLVRSLRDLHSLPGNLAVRPHTVLRTLFEEVGWAEDLAREPEMLRHELGELRRHIAEWELLDPHVAAAQPRRSWLQRAIDWMRGRTPAAVVPTGPGRSGRPSGSASPAGPRALNPR